MTTDQTETASGDPSRALLETLIERWQEVADAYKNNPPRDDLDRRYNDYRHIYLRNIRDLQQVLDSGRVPCSLMTDEERSRGDCGQVHDDEHHDKYGAASPDIDPWTWAEMSPAERRLAAAERIVVGHLAEALIDGKTDELRTWIRSLTHELRRADIDLREPVGARVTEIALGRLAEEHPF
jgi:hypothetical protein